MNLRTRTIIILGKFVSILSQSFRLGAGATWPGEIALRLSPHILRQFAKQPVHITLVAGTNGKTTTVKMIETILVHAKKRVRRNASGANLDNGLISAFIDDARLNGTLRSTHFIFEVDEATLPNILTELTPSVLVLTNLFRDQLDRYGEVDVIAQKWEAALSKLDKNTTLILNADDPQVAHLGKQYESRVRYFGVSDERLFLKKREHATDSIFCLNCGARLTYSGIYYSHLGIWKCKECGETRPKPNLSAWKTPLPGLYNLYNTLAAVSVAKALKISDQSINAALVNFHPAFGRQEGLTVNGKKIKLFLSKNPAGFNASLRTVLEMKPSILLFVLNDRIPDGRDVSWIWDVDFEMIPDSTKIIVSGDRVYDMALRLKYTFRTINYKLKTKNLSIEPNLKEALQVALQITRTGETLFILPTYSAMLEVRKILTGKKIL